MAGAENGIALSERLVGLLTNSVFDRQERPFVPENSLNDVIATDSIFMAMDVEEPTEDDYLLADFILKRAKKIFAIAVDIELQDSNLRRAMLLFRDREFDDDKLPIEYTLNSSLASPTINVLAALEVGVQQKRIWTNKKVMLFNDSQWKFLSPVFSMDRFNYDFKPHTILPFISKDINVDKGSFGQVFKYEIHPCHFRDIDMDRQERPRSEGPLYFAIKEIQPGDTKDRQKVVQSWGLEAKALQRMNSLNQNHIVRFITAFRRGQRGNEDHYLMFEWADGGNLRTLWKTCKQPLSAKLIRGVTKQLLGLANALEAAHYLDKSGASFRHGDLKPENILWFKSGDDGIGTLKICDWGISKEHNIITELRTNNTTAEYGTRRYEAPEVETGISVAKRLDQSIKPLDKPIKRRSRLYDIWAMGCITLEFIIWLVYGQNGLLKFNASVKGDSPDNGSFSSPFYQIRIEGGKKVARVHHVVVQWMDEMAKDPSFAVGTTALGDLLELVREKLLVVKLPRRMGDTGLGNPPTRLGRVPRRSMSPNDDIEHLEPGIQQAKLDIPTVKVTKADETSGVSPTEPREGEQSNITSNGISQANAEPPLQPEPDPTPGPARALATELRARIESILGEDENDDYWFIGESSNLRVPGGELFNPQQIRTFDYSTEEVYGSSLASRPKEDHAAGGNRLVAPKEDQLDNDWALHVDNEFASDFLSSYESLEPSEISHGPDPSQLCSDCQKLDFWSPAFNVTYSVSELKDKSKSSGCNLCGLFWRTCERRGGEKFPTVRFERAQSSLKMNGGGTAVLSIFRSIDLKTRVDADIQIGFGKLPKLGSQTQWNIIRKWLDLCDNKHKDSTCPPVSRERDVDGAAPKQLPTRLIDVGNEGDDIIRLWEPGRGEKAEWIALSYQWGSAPHFFTDQTNIRDHLEKGMDFETFPATFKDAAIVTRALGRRYLWIDSICIIQGEGGDFNQEAKRMEEVYSGAYCVLAASCATGHYSGFLRQRKEREFVTLYGPDQAPFYICESIDDFNLHVLEGDLNQRGWVLQEHALARRTIFFTESQMYWECGDGVRCETMMKMTNNLAAFIGDPQFPQILMRAPQGERIIRLQDLYKKYSRLDLSKNYDRPMAIDGLEKRIHRALSTKGGLGIFDEGEQKGLLRRSLLWYRGPDTTTLTPIDFPSDRDISVVPSWSWMAYTGGIDFLDPKFGGMDWLEIQSPWSYNGQYVVRTEGQKGNIALTAEARDYNPSTALGGEGLIIFDNPGHSEQPKTRCVVLGIAQEDIPLSDKKHYLLIISPTASLDSDGKKIYRRAGAGYLPGKCIGTSGPMVNIQ